MAFVQKQRNHSTPMSSKNADVRLCPTHALLVFFEHRSCNRVRVRRTLRAMRTSIRPKIVVDTVWSKWAPVLSEPIRGRIRRKLVGAITSKISSIIRSDPRGVGRMRIRDAVRTVWTSILSVRIVNAVRRIRTTTPSVHIRGRVWVVLVSAQPAASNRLS